MIFAGTTYVLFGKGAKTLRNKIYVDEKTYNIQHSSLGSHTHTHDMRYEQNNNEKLLLNVYT